MKKQILSIILLISLPAAMAQEVTFSKARYSSVKQPKESDVDLSITASKIAIKSKNKSRSKGNPAESVDMEIPFSAIDTMSYELASRHRVGEGALLMTASLGAGAILMATKTKSHWLAIESHEGEVKQVTVLRLDKSEYSRVISTLEDKTGRHIAVLDSKTSALNPTAESKNIDELVPFGMDKVVTALKSAMESEGCKVTEATGSHVECKRARGYSERTGAGGEKVTATLEASGEKTRVRIWTGKGTMGRMQKKNWSTAVYKEMMKTLQNAPSA
jgi:hypothetical protein